MFYSGFHLSLRPSKSFYVKFGKCSRNFSSQSSQRINRILIANRGEIALRILRTSRRLGIEVVAVYSDEDINAKYVKMADNAWHLGPAPSLQSYLCKEKLIEVALKAGAQVNCY